MRIYIEALILYIVLFLSGSIFSTVNNAGEAVYFSSTAELTRIFIYNIPSLVLIWYLLTRIKPLKSWGIVPGKKDIVSGFVAFSCLFITGIMIAFISSYISGTYAQTTLRSPSTVHGWIILCFSCISAAYLEESYFRFFLLSRRDELKLSDTQALAVSAALFSICHIYGGPWAFLNAALSGAFLGIIFLRYQAIHGIAVAHGIYNIMVYLINSILMQSSVNPF